MSKITELAEVLRKLLASGLFPPGARFISEYEIENRYDVSRITANKAVSILATEGLLERGKRGSGTFVRRVSKFPKGWIAAVETLNSFYNSQIMAGAAREAYASGYMLSVLRPHESNLQDIFNDLADSDCIGVIGVTTLLSMVPEDYPKPVIHIDGTLAPPGRKNINSVTCGNFQAAYDMMQRIVNSGKKEIVFTGLGYKNNRRERLNGFMAAMEDNNINDAKKRQFNMHDGTLHEIRLTLRRMLAEFPNIDFIATDSDEIAFRFMKVAQTENIDIPGKIALSGFGNIHGIADLHDLPTVDQHPWHLGVAAVKGLVDIVENLNTDVIQLEIPSEIVNSEFI